MTICSAYLVLVSLQFFGQSWNQHKHNQGTFSKKKIQMMTHRFRFIINVLGPFISNKMLCKYQ